MHTNAMGKKKSDDTLIARRFFEAKAFLDAETEALLVEHLATCNRLTRTLFARSIAQGLPAKDIYSRELSLKLAPELAALNVDQANIVSRSVVAMRRRAIGAAKFRAERATKLVNACQTKMDALESALTGLQGPRTPAEIDVGFARRQTGAQRIRAKIELHRAAKLEQMAIRRQAQHEVDSGLAPVCFGGAGLAAQRHGIGDMGCAFKTVAVWKASWECARDGTYFFEGNGVALGRNRNVKAEVSAGTASLRIRLSDASAERLMEGKARAAGISAEEFKASPNPNHGTARMACRFLGVELAALGKRQLERLSQLATALNLNGDDAVPVAWTISWAWETKPGGEVARRFKFHASWVEHRDVATRLDNGAVGFQVEGDQMHWAWVDRSGNPAKNRKAADGARLAWHGSMPIGSQLMPERRRLQVDREAAMALARIALARACPCALEAVAIPLRRLELGLKDSAKAMPVHLDVRPELGDAVAQANARLGVSTIGVGASYAAEIGFAKFGACDGLSPASAAAIVIGRAALPSQSTRTVKDIQGEAVHKRWDGPPAWAAAAKATPAKRSRMRKSSRQQSMVGKSWNDLKAFSENLGKDRSIWGSKLKGYRTSCRAGQQRPANAAQPKASGLDGGGPRQSRGMGARGGKAAHQQAGVMSPTIQTKRLKGTPSEPPSTT